jgi:hypothetical protein
MQDFICSCPRMTEAARILSIPDKPASPGKAKPGPRAINFVDFRAAGAPRCS